MTIKLLYFAALRDVFGRGEEFLELPAESTLAELGERLALRTPGLRPHLASLAWGLNLEFAGPQSKIQDGDEVALLPPVSGGAA
jgi:molybdopterin converting factor small subunit